MKEIKTSRAAVILLLAEAKEAAKTECRKLEKAYSLRQCSQYELADAAKKLQTISDLLLVMQATDMEMEALYRNLKAQAAAKRQTSLFGQHPR